MAKDNIGDIFDARYPALYILRCPQVEPAAQAAVALTTDRLDLSLVNQRRRLTEEPAWAGLCALSFSRNCGGATDCCRDAVGA